MRPFLLAIALSLAILPPAAADDAPALKVATRVLPPFVVDDGGRLTGFSVELTDAIAAEAKLKLDYVRFDTLPELIAAVKDGKADLASAAISITSERERDFDFSQPVFSGGVQIMTRAGSAQNGSIIPSFIAFFSSKPFFELIGALLLLFTLPSPLIWWLERRHEQGAVQAESKVGEFFNSMYWSATTLVGQSAGHPRSLIGRLIALAWMIIGVTFVSYFTATVTSALTVERLESSIGGLRDLVGKPVATVEGSTSASFLKANGVAATGYSNARQAFDALLGERSQAVVYDAPILLYFASHEGAGKVRLVGDLLRPEDYGILFPNGSDKRKTFDEALIRLRESGDFKRIYDHWFAAPGG